MVGAVAAGPVGAWAADGGRQRPLISAASVVSGLGSELVERDVCREQLVYGVRLSVGLAERGDREPRSTTIADHGHDLDRLAICVLLVPFAEEQAPARGRRQAAQ
ncbi:MAG: hypothetical protein ACTHQQ_19365 [Solirubrobacteraceae bacterium]